MNGSVKINGLTINKNESSNRIYEIVLKDEILDKLIDEENEIVFNNIASSNDQNLTTNVFLLTRLSL